MARRPSTTGWVPGGPITGRGSGTGDMIQRVVIRPVERAPVLTLVIVTLGLATLINGLAGFLFGYVPRSFPSPFSVQTVSILGAFASYQDLGVIVVSAIVLVLMYVLLQRTPIGLAMRAAAHQPEASRLLGIRVSWMLALGWGLASAVGAVSGIMAAPALLSALSTVLAPSPEGGPA